MFGDNCIVCCVPFNRIYPELVLSQVAALKETGFNGYYLYQIGGFPNPTGKEIRHVGVPHSFKIFMTLEAQRLGFSALLGGIPNKSG